MLVVGTRGRSLSGFQGLMPGSVSKYCLQYSPVPVIVVRPSSKRDKKKRKRMRDPARRGYRDILDKSGDAEEGGHILDARNRRSILSPETLSELGKRDAEEEARMVAEAIGYRPDKSTSLSEGTPLSRVISGRSDISGRSARSGSMGSYASEDLPDDPKSPAGKLMKSPELRDMDSPPGSDYEYSDEDEMEVVPAYVLQQEEALQRARERAIEAEREEREREEERTKKEEERKRREEERKKKENDKPKRGKGGDDYEGAAGALAALDALGGGGGGSGGGTVKKHPLIP